MTKEQCIFIVVSNVMLSTAIKNQKITEEVLDDLIERTSGFYDYVREKLKDG